LLAHEAAFRLGWGGTKVSRFAITIECWKAACPLPILHILYVISICFCFVALGYEVTFF